MNDRQPRIMQLISNLAIGGAQEVVRTLAEQLAAAGCFVVVCAFADGPLRAEIEAAGIPVEILPDRKSSVVQLPSFMKEMGRIRRELTDLVNHYRIDIIQTHLLRSLDFLALSVRAAQPVRVFWTFHNANFDLRADHLQTNHWLLAPKRQAHHLLYSLGARRIGGIIAVAPGVREALLAGMPGIPAEKISVINNCVDVRRYDVRDRRESVRAALGLSPTDRVVATVAIFKEQKGHKFLVEAVSMLRETHPDLHVLLIGDGELRQQVAAQVAAADLDTHVHLLGMRQDIPALLGATDLFVLPSLWEGLPMALIEAMAATLPVVATSVSGTRDVVLDGKTGLLVAPGDSRALAEAIDRLLADPQQAAQMGRAGRRRVEQQYGAGRQAEEHLILFEQSTGTEDRTVLGWR